MKHFTLPQEGGLLARDLPDDILHGYDKIYTEVHPDSTIASRKIADIVVEAIKKFEAENPGKLFRLGLTTGESPASLYKVLSRYYKEGRISFRNVSVFSIDEYYPSSPDQMQSRNYRLHQELLGNVDILPENIHVPDGTVPHENIAEYCAKFDAAASGLDLLIMGIGEQGQVGFNEAGSSEVSRTRTVLLSYKSRKRQSNNFNGDVSVTPKQAITMGVGTMLSAKRVILMALGEDKVDAVARVSEGHVGTDCPATFFQHHPNVRLYVDEVSGSQLTRVVAPWLIGPCEWTPKFRRKAVVWLCQKVGKPILKLTHADYLKNSLEELVEHEGSYNKVNIDVFNDLQHTITGWPGGKPNADDSTRPVASKPFPKKVLVFSPHPDDDVISMGGTLIRLQHQGHDVHVAYETSGNVAVHDSVVMQHIDAAAQLGYGDRTAEVQALVDAKVPGEPEPRGLLDIKAAIRRSEARGACHSFGMKDDHIHFLNLPFYESGGIRKLPCSDADVEIIKKLMEEIKPDQIYMAGDLADPHGTHRVCTEAALEAFTELEEAGAPWVKDCHIWMYRGAWMEWELSRVDMAVPLSPDEVIEKRHAIYRHLSQKDIVPFPGEDPREFWQRAEDRTQATAKAYDELGMAEYQAIEVFLKLR
ncbi:MAG: glucosamine-6-phosphate deaminase [Bacteroidales bacterium]|nr:glucosamine-6-phosphate deaminase [Bacteroidales bacterium]